VARIGDDASKAVTAARSAAASVAPGQIGTQD
jgi:hypothetical protein